MYNFMHKSATHLHNSMQSMCSSKPENTTPEFDMQTSLSQRPANWRLNLTMNTSTKKLVYKSSVPWFAEKTRVISFGYAISHTVCQKKARYNDAINYICHLHDCEVNEQHTHSNHLSSIEDFAECRVLQKTNRHKKHRQQTWQQKTQVQFVSRNFKCDTCWSSAMEASTFAITSDDKQLV